MGRGDKRTRKGKISAGSYGVVRKRTKTTKAPTKRPAATKAPAKKPATKK
jgi:30S ribosomal protein S31